MVGENDHTINNATEVYKGWHNPLSMAKSGQKATTENSQIPSKARK